jgi:isocitrate dehydrogenase kinase/phosphatase
MAEFLLRLLIGPKVLKADLLEQFLGLISPKEVCEEHLLHLLFLQRRRRLFSSHHLQHFHHDMWLKLLCLNQLFPFLPYFQSRKGVQ